MILPFHLQIILSIFVFFAGKEKRRLFWVRLCACLVPYCVLPFIPFGGQNWVNIVYADFFAPWVVAVLIAAAGCMLFAYRASFEETLFAMTAAFAFSLFYSCSCYWLGKLTDSVALSSVLYLALFVALYVAGALFVRKNKKLWEGGEKHLLAFLLLVCLACYTIELWSQLWEIEVIEAKNMANALGIICSLALEIALFGVLRAIRVHKEATALERMFVSEEKQKRLFEETIEAINIKSHDLKYQLNAIREEMQAEKDRDILANFNREVQLYDSFVHTGNKSLDTVLTEKSLLCEKNNIRFSCIADGRTLRNIRPLDIYILFGNALDNAIEGTLKIKDENLRDISLSIRAKGAYAGIHIDNSAAEPAQFEGGVPKSSKADKKSHGFGFRSMMHIVQQYGGNMKAEMRGDHFVLNILLPIDPPGREGRPADAQ